MAEKALQVNFNYDVPVQALMEGTAKSASEIASKPGLRWKIWIYNDETKEAGGLYLFEDDASADAYTEWVRNALENNPAAERHHDQEIRHQRERYRRYPRPCRRTRRVLASAFRASLLEIDGREAGRELFRI